MRIVIDDETAALLESERAARGLRSPTEANKQIVREAAEFRAYTSRTVTDKEPMKTKKGRKK